MVTDSRWCSRTIVRPSDVARVMQLLKDDERLSVVARRLDVPPSVVSRLWRSYQETGEYTRNRVNAVSGWQHQNKTVFLYCCLSAIAYVQLKPWKLTSAVLFKFTCPTRMLGINSIMMVRENQATGPRGSSPYASVCSAIQLCWRASQLTDSSLEANTLHRCEQFY